MKVKRYKDGCWTAGLPFSRSDVERLERTWAESHRLRVLRKEQRLLKAELASAKSRLLVPADRWSYEREYVLTQLSRTLVLVHVYRRAAVVP